MPSVQIQLLGHFHVVYHDEPVLISQARLQSLLGYLAIHNDAPQLRQHLAFLIWPDSSEAHARNSLRKLLYDLRQALPDIDALLAIEHGMVYWRDPASVTVDVVAFSLYLAHAEQAANRLAVQAALEKAVAFYSGELLPACYEEWVLRERERLHQQYLGTLERLSQLCAEQRDYNSALAYAQRLVQADPLQESAYRLLMQLYMESHDRARALRVYHTCATLLAQELGVDPSPETQIVYQRLLNMESSAAIAPMVQPRANSLIGRQEEREKLQCVWHETTQHGPHFVVIAGEAGIGKSRLAEEMLLWANEQSITTAHARAYAAEGSIVYAPVRDWLRSEPLQSVLGRLDAIWLSEIARLLPELLIQRPDVTRPEPLTEQWQRQRLFEALSQAFTTAKTPLFLVLDDLQWCDRETLEWLHYLLRFDPKARMLVIGTMRSEEVDAQHVLTTLLLNLRSAGILTEIELGPLDTAETAKLASQLAERELDPQITRRLYQATEGNPLFVVETVRAGLPDSAAEKEHSRIPSSGDRDLLPPKVQAVIQMRLTQLSSEARHLAQLAATIGREFSVDVLARATELSEEALVYSLDELWQRRIVRERGANAYDFSHDRIRETTYTSISLARRRLLHRRVAQALEYVYASDLDSVSGQIAAHYEFAGLLENALLSYQRAALAAQRIYAHSEAIHFLDKGLALLRQLPVTPEHLGQELRLQLALGVSLANTRGLAAPEVRETYVRAYELAVQVGDDRERLVAVGGLHISELSRGQILGSYELAKEGLSLAERIGDPSGLVEACGRLGTALLFTGQWRASRNYLEQALAHTEYQWDSSSRFLWPHHQGVVARRNLAFVLWNLGYPDQAQEEMDRALQLAYSVAHPLTLAGTLERAAWLHRLRREPAEGYAIARRGIMLCQEQGFHSTLPRLIAVEGWVLAQQGQIEAGLARVHGERVMLAAMESNKRDTIALVLAEVYGLAGQPEDGMRLLDKALSWIEAMNVRDSLAELHRVKGELLQKWGAHEQEAEDCFVQALAIAQQQEAKSLELRTCISLGRLWQHQGKRQQAYDLLSGVYSWFTEGFQTHDLQEAAALLHSLSQWQP